LQIPCPLLSSVIMCRSRRQNLTSNFMVKVVYKSFINKKCELLQTSWCRSVYPLFATRNCTHPHASFVCPLLQEIAMMMVNKLSQISLNLQLPATPLSTSLYLSLPLSLSLSLSLSLWLNNARKSFRQSLHVTVLKKTSDEMRLAVANPV